MAGHINKWSYVFSLVLIMAFVLGMGEQGKKLELVTVQHTVRQGETLWDIGEKYITPDRYMPEFVEGIYELNYDRVFVKREKNGAPRRSVYPGDVLEIHFWR